MIMLKKGSVVVFMKFVIVLESELIKANPGVMSHSQEKNKH